MRHNMTRLSMAIGLLGLGGLGLSGCAVPESTPVKKTYPFLLVETVPSGATLSFPEGTSCETPCPVNITYQMRMTVAKAGYKPVVYTLYDNTPGELLVELELVAPTTEVEETGLPDL